MQRILRKRILRDLKKNFPRYLALGLMIVFGIYIIISLIGSADTIIVRTLASDEEHQLEDGRFRTFVPLKYGSRMRPVLLRIMSVRPAALRESQYAEVLRSCQTMALQTGFPVAASHTMVVSRWLVMPIAAMS